jgi:hypothetical protein
MPALVVVVVEIVKVPLISLTVTLGSGVVE